MTHHTVSFFCGLFLTAELSQRNTYGIINTPGTEELPGDWQMTYQDINWTPPALSRVKQMSLTGDL